MHPCIIWHQCGHHKNLQLKLWTCNFSLRSQWHSRGPPVRDGQSAKLREMHCLGNCTAMVFIGTSENETQEQNGKTGETSSQQTSTPAAARMGGHSCQSLSDGRPTSNMVVARGPHRWPPQMQLLWSLLRLYTSGQALHRAPASCTPCQGQSLHATCHCVWHVHLSNNQNGLLVIAQQELIKYENSVRISSSYCTFILSRDTTLVHIPAALWRKGG